MNDNNKDEIHLYSVEFRRVQIIIRKRYMNYPVMKRICLLVACLSPYIFSHAQTPVRSGELPSHLRSFINEISYQPLGDAKPVIRYESVSKNIWKVSLVWIPKDSVRQDDWKIIIHPTYKSIFH